LRKCTDGRQRELSCRRSAPDEKDPDGFCACMIGDKMGASFMPQSRREIGGAVGNSLRHDEPPRDKTWEDDRRALA